MTNSLPKLASFWFGGPLSPIEQASAISFLMAGHQLTLYTVGEVGGIPPGVQVKSAQEVFPSEDIVRHKKTGSPALHSDLFRYALLSKTDQIWVDLDIILIKPLNNFSGYLFAFESQSEVNGAILSLPQKSAALQELSKYNRHTRGFPEYLSGWRLIRYYIKSFGRGLPIEKWPWGSIGPRALTYHLGVSGEIKHALPKESFYPIPFERAGDFLLANKRIEEELSEYTIAVHLWGNSLRKIINQTHEKRIPENSYLWREIKKSSDWADFNIETKL